MADLTPSRRTRGILCILLAALCFSAMSACVRLAGDDLPTIQKAFFRNFVALLAALALIRRKGVSWKPARKSLPALLGRSVFGTAGLILNFYAIDHLALADANMLNKLSPFFAILFSVWLLREKPDAVQIGAVAVAFLGSLCIMKPGFQDTPFRPSRAFSAGWGPASPTPSSGSLAPWGRTATASCSSSPPSPAPCVCRGCSFPTRP